MNGSIAGMDWVLSCRLSQTKLRRDKAVTIGRQGCDVLIKSGVEPKHAAVFFNSAEQTYYLRDLAGTSGDGIFVNGDKMESDVAPLALNDRVRFGYSHTTYIVEQHVSGPDAAVLQLDDLCTPSLDQAYRPVDSTRHVASPSSNAPSAAQSPVKTMRTFSPLSDDAANVDLSVSKVMSSSSALAYQPQPQPVDTSRAAQLTSPPPTAAEHSVLRGAYHTTAIPSERNSGNGIASSVASLPSHRIAATNDASRAVPSGDGGSDLYGVPNWWGQGQDSVAEIHSVRHNPFADAPPAPQSSGRPVSRPAARTPSSSHKTAASGSSNSLSSRSQSSLARRAITPDAPRTTTASPVPIKRTGSLRVSKTEKSDSKSTVERRKPPLAPSASAPLAPAEKSAKAVASPQPIRENTTVALRRAASARRAAVDAASKQSGTQSPRRGNSPSIRRAKPPLPTGSSLPPGTKRPLSATASLPPSAALEEKSTKENPAKNNDAVKRKFAGRSASVQVRSAPLVMSSRSPFVKAKSQQHDTRSPRQPLRATASLSSSSASSLSSNSPSPNVRQRSSQSKPSTPKSTVRTRSPWRSIRDEARRNMSAQNGSQPPPSADVVFMHTPSSDRHGSSGDGEENAGSKESGQQIDDPQHDELRSAGTPDSLDAANDHSHGNGDEQAESGSGCDSSGNNASSSVVTTDNGSESACGDLDMSAVSSNTSLDSTGLVSGSGSGNSPDLQRASLADTQAQAAPAPAAKPRAVKPVFLTEAEADAVCPQCTVCKLSLSACNCGSAAATAPASAIGPAAHAADTTLAAQQLWRRKSCPDDKHTSLSAFSASDTTATEGSNAGTVSTVAPVRRQWNKMEKMDGLIVSSLVVLSDRLQQATIDMCRQAQSVQEWQKQQGTDLDCGLLDRLDLDSGSPSNPDALLYPPWGAEHQDMAAVMRNIRIAEARVKAISELLGKMPGSSSG